MKTPRLAIISTHPIQYYAPVFAQLAARNDLEIHVYYGYRGLTEQSIDHGFGQKIAWDIPLLDDYSYEFVDNIAKDPGSHHFRGIDLPSLISRIEAWGADAVLIMGWCYRSHLEAMRYFSGRIPVFFRGDSTLLDEKAGLKQIARRWFLRWVYRHVDFALYVGTNNRRYFEAHGLRPDQLVFAPHSIDNDRFCAAENEEATNHLTAANLIRCEIGAGDEQIVVLFVGKFESKKAPDVLIEAFNRFSDANAHLVMIGSGIMQEQLEKLGGRNVHFVGFKNQSELPDWYRAADLVTLPSRGPGETWGLAVNEAMACERAVIASDRVGSAIDLIQQGVNGWICKAGDQEDLANSLSKAVRLGRSALAEMGHKGRTEIERWSIGRQADSIATAILKNHQLRR